MIAVILKDPIILFWTISINERNARIDQELENTAQKQKKLQDAMELMDLLEAMDKKTWKASDQRVDKNEQGEGKKDLKTNVETVSLDEDEIKVIEDTDIPGVIKVKEWNPKKSESKLSKGVILKVASTQNKVTPLDLSLDQSSQDFSPQKSGTKSKSINSQNEPPPNSPAYSVMYEFPPKVPLKPRVTKAPPNTPK